MSTNPPIELRVHGVSGTPPPDLLDRPLVIQVAGDRKAGFYRPRLESERLDNGPDPLTPVAGGPGPELEGYCWGGLTSGSPGRALWLLLLPFTLVNVAVRARPAYGPGHPRVTQLFWSTTRLLALTMTGLFVVTGIGLGRTLVAECPASCPGARTSWLLGWIPGLDPGWRSLVGALLPLALLLVLWVVSTRTASQYESVTPSVTTAAGGTSPHRRAPRELEPALTSPGMWQNATHVRRLRALHVQFGLALVSASLLWSSGWLVLPLIVAAHAVVGVALPPLPDAAEQKLARMQQLGWGGTFLALAVAVVGVATTAPVDRSSLASSVSKAFGQLTSADLVAGVVLLVVLLGVNARAASLPPDGTDTAPMTAQASACRGYAASYLAGFAFFLAAVFSGGTYLYGSAFLLTGSLRPTFDDVTGISAQPDLPPVIGGGAIAYSLGVAWSVVIVLVWGVIAAVKGGLIGSAGRDRTAQRQLVADYGAPTDPSRASAIARALSLGALVDRAPSAIMSLAGGGLLLCVGLAAFSAGTAMGGSLAAGSGPTHHAWAVLQGLGAYLAVFTLVGLVALGSLAFRVPTTRRSVGILWDVASFWPRTAHPLAAPCYAERTVPDLVTRISWFLNAERRPVVLAAHSQGTVIGAAAILHLSQAMTRDPGLGDLDDLRFLTCGCVLRRLYGRYFPAYFGPRGLRQVHDALGGDRGPARWINLWRYTDYLGGQVSAGPPQLVPELVPPEAPPVGADGAVGTPSTALPTWPQRWPQDWEWHCPDPHSVDRPAGSTTFGRPKRHSDFWSDESGFFQEAVIELVRRSGPVRAAAGSAAPSGTVPTGVVDGASAG